MLLVKDKLIPRIAADGTSIEGNGQRPHQINRLNPLHIHFCTTTQAYVLQEKNGNQYQTKGRGSIKEMEKYGINVVKI